MLFLFSCTQRLIGQISALYRQLLDAQGSIWMWSQGSILPWGGRRNALCGGWEPKWKPKTPASPRRHRKLLPVPKMKRRTWILYDFVRLFLAVVLQVSVSVSKVFTKAQHNPTKSPDSTRRSRPRWTWIVFVSLNPSSPPVLSTPPAPPGWARCNWTAPPATSARHPRPPRRTANGPRRCRRHLVPWTECHGLWMKRKWK